MLAADFLNAHSGFPRVYIPYIPCLQRFTAFLNAHSGFPLVYIPYIPCLQRFTAFLNAHSGFPLVYIPYIPCLQQFSACLYSTAVLVESSGFPLFRTFHAKSGCPLFLSCHAFGLFLYHLAQLPNSHQPELLGRDGSRDPSSHRVGSTLVGCGRRAALTPCSFSDSMCRFGGNCQAIICVGGRESDFVRVGAWRSMGWGRWQDRRRGLRPCTEGAKAQDARLAVYSRILSRVRMGSHVGCACNSFESH
jgi:hypothetical protein